MPNWNENELTIFGPDVQKVLDAIRSDDSDDGNARILDFDRIIPCPQQYRGLDQRAREYQQKWLAIPLSPRTTGAGTTGDDPLSHRSAGAGTAGDFPPGLTLRRDRRGRLGPPGGDSPHPNRQDL